MYPNYATFKLPHKVSLLTDTRRINGTPHPRKHGSEMRPRAAKRPGALPQPHIDRRRISPSATSQAKTRGREGTKRRGERDSGKRPGGERTADCTHCPILTGRPHLSPKTTKYIECISRTSLLSAYSAPPHDCPHRATSGDPHEVPSLMRSLLGGDMRPLGIAPSHSPNHDTPWQPPTQRTCSPHTSRRATHRMTPHHPYITRNTTDSHITAYASLTLPPEHHEFAPHAPSRVNPRNSHLNIAHGIENRGHKAHQVAPEPLGTEGSGGIPPPSHHYQAFTMLRASTTPAYPNAPIPPTTHAEEHYPIPYSVTQQHSGGNI